MIYLDNAATTHPKPKMVNYAVINALSYSANPGRAGHRMSIKASETVFNCRNKLCNLFNFDKPENVILTPGCTYSLNMVIKGTLSKGDHVVISSFEHNSVLRPLQKLSDSDYITYTVADVFEADNERTLESFRKAIQDNTKLVICTHASNVFGIKLPIYSIGSLAHYYGVMFCVDGAQTAGIHSIDMSCDSPIDFLCLPGHKGLYGPMGTGVLIINTNYAVDSLCEGGTGSSTIDFKHPQILPDKLESGTLNLPGIAGLSAGVDFVARKSTDAILKHEINLMKKLYHSLSHMNNVILYTQEPDINNHAPLLSFNIKDTDSEDVSYLLDKNYSIATRAGIHCSPLAHKYMKTDKTGTVRICPSAFTTEYDINVLERAIYNISKFKKFTK
ncbi:MAG: aminotransferase class V-fold PLP-dependent enzyme [Ruminococcaceae bacterium]|nr:aminotransferase class V-fold PLP-dependent enzyme [Oscillospiraceae bacterium]